MQEWLQMQIFYNGLDGNLKSRLDGSLGGDFMNNNYEWACQLIKDMAMNSYMWPNGRFTYSQKPYIANVVHELDKYKKNLEKLNRLETTSTRLGVQTRSTWTNSHL